MPLLVYLRNRLQKKTAPGVAAGAHGAHGAHRQPAAPDAAAVDARWQYDARVAPGDAGAVRRMSTQAQERLRMSGAHSDEEEARDLGEGLSKLRHPR